VAHALPSGRVKSTWNWLPPGTGPRTRKSILGNQLLYLKSGELAPGDQAPESCHTLTRIVFLRIVGPSAEPRGWDARAGEPSANAQPQIRIKSIPLIITELRRVSKGLALHPNL